MRIVYIHQYFKTPDKPGGTRPYDLAKKFVEEGNDVTIIASSSDIKHASTRWAIEKRDGISIHYIYIPYNFKLSYFQRTVVFIKFLWFATIRVLKLKSDVVIASSTPLTIGIPGLIKSLLSKTPFIFEVRDVWPEAAVAIGAVKNPLLIKLLVYLEKALYFKATAIIPLSVDMQSSIIKRFPKVSRKASTVIENISEVNRFQGEYNAERKIIQEIVGFTPRFTVLYAGAFGSVNGLDYVINLAKHTIYIDPEIIYLLVGKGLHKESVKAVAQNEGLLDKNVFIVDPISKSELPQLYYECSMGSSFVVNIKELWANSANKFFDTIASGRPILINYGGWQKKAILNNNLGYVLPPEINKNAAIRFAEYSRDEQLHMIQRENALRQAKKSYSLDIATEKYLGILNQTAG